MASVTLRARAAGSVLRLLCTWRSPTGKCGKQRHLYHFVPTCAECVYAQDTGVPVYAYHWISNHAILHSHLSGHLWLGGLGGTVYVYALRGRLSLLTRLCRSQHSTVRLGFRMHPLVLFHLRLLQEQAEVHLAICWYQHCLVYRH